MKSPLRLVLLSMAAAVVAGLAYLQYEHVTYIRTYLEERVGLRDFSLRQKVHNDHQWYAKVGLGKGEDTKLLARFAFVPTYNPALLLQADKPQNEFIRSCANCQYYLETRGHGMYGYVVYCLHADQQLEVFQGFGD